MICEHFGKVISCIVLYSVTGYICESNDACEVNETCTGCILSWGNNSKYYTCDTGFQLTGYITKHLPRSNTQSKNDTNYCDYSLHRPGNNYLLVSEDNKSISLNCSKDESSQIWRDYIYCATNDTHWRGFIPICQNQRHSGSTAVVVAVIVCIVGMIITIGVAVSVRHVRRRKKMMQASGDIELANTTGQDQGSLKHTEVTSSNRVSTVHNNTYNTHFEEVIGDGDYTQICKVSKSVENVPDTHKLWTSKETHLRVPEKHYQQPVHEEEQLRELRIQVKQDSEASFKHAYAHIYINVDDTSSEAVWSPYDKIKIKNGR